MNVGSLLEIYTTMFGWSIYGLMYDLFSATGLILWPFIMMIIKNWKEPLQSQNEKAASVVSKNRVTVDTVTMMLVVMLAVVPYAGLDVNEIRYRVACTDKTGSTEVFTDVNGRTTGTTYDTHLAAINNVQIPILWWLTLSIGAGTNTAMSQSFTCFEDIKGLDQQLRNLTIKDQMLRHEYFRFANECFLPAKSKYAEATRGGNYHEYVSKTEVPAFLASTMPDGVKLQRHDDFFYIGSQFYLQTAGFYREFNIESCSAQPGGCGFKARSGVYNWPVNQSRDRYPQKRIDNPDPNNPLYGKPYCDEWWTDSTRGLKRKLLGSIEASQVIIDIDDSVSWADELIASMKNGYAHFTHSDQELEDIVIKRYVAQDPPSFLPDHGGLFGSNDFVDVTVDSPSQRREQGAALLAGAAGVALLAKSGVGKKAFSAVSSGASSASKSYAAQLADFYTNMFIVKQAAPMVQSILLMLIYMLALIYFVMTDFDIDSTIQMVFVILGFQFFTTLWHFADYLDAQLFVSLFPDATWLGGVATYGPNRLVLDIVLTLLYVVAPFVLLWIMNMAGSKVGNLGNSMGPLARAPNSKGTGDATKRLMP